jgi:hypothetical protein
MCYHIIELSLVVQVWLVAILGYIKKKHRFIVLLICYFYKTEAISLSGPNASSCNFTLCNVMLIAAA